MTTTIHPLLGTHESVYSPADADPALHEWVAAAELLPLDGVARCVHGLYGLKSCPSSCPAVPLDHARWWLPAEGRPFLLAHSYAAPESVVPTARELAAHHGLHVSVLPADAWYGSGTTPLRYSLTGYWDTTLAPLEVALLAYDRWSGAVELAYEVEDRVRRLGWHHLPEHHTTTGKA